MASSGRPIRVGKYRVVRLLGSGSFAHVFLAEHEEEGRLVAIKCISLSRLDARSHANLEAEIAIMRHMEHPHIVRLYEVLKSKQYMYLVLEYCEGGDLGAALRRHGPLGEADARRVFAQFASALEYLWSRSVVHRDLKPQNLLLTGGSFPRECVVKIADFGFARHLDQSSLAETLCGTPLYMAPEVLGARQYDRKCDLWSAGVILYQMLVGHVPFTASNQLELLSVIERSAPGATLPATVARAVSSDVAQLVRDTLRCNPESRIGFAEFVSHPFVRGSPSYVATLPPPVAATVTATAPATATATVPSAAAPIATGFGDVGGDSPSASASALASATPPPSAPFSPPLGPSEVRSPRGVAEGRTRRLSSLRGVEDALDGTSATATPTSASVSRGTPDASAGVAAAAAAAAGAGGASHSPRPTGVLHMRADETPPPPRPAGRSHSASSASATPPGPGALRVSPRASLGADAEAGGGGSVSSSGLWDVGGPLNVFGLDAAAPESEATPGPGWIVISTADGRLQFPLAPLPASSSSSSSSSSSPSLVTLDPPQPPAVAAEAPRKGSGAGAAGAGTGAGVGSAPPPSSSSSRLDAVRAQSASGASTTPPTTTAATTPTPAPRQLAAALEHTTAAVASAATGLLAEGVRTVFGFMAQSATPTPSTSPSSAPLIAPLPTPPATTASVGKPQPALTPLPAPAPALPRAAALPGAVQRLCDASFHAFLLGTHAASAAAVGGELPFLSLMNAPTGLDPAAAAAHAGASADGGGPGGGRAMWGGRAHVLAVLVREWRQASGAAASPARQSVRLHVRALVLFLACFEVALAVAHALDRLEASGAFQPAMLEARRAWSKRARLSAATHARASLCALDRVAAPSSRRAKRSPVAAAPVAPAEDGTHTPTTEWDKALLALRRVEALLDGRDGGARARTPGSSLDVASAVQVMRGAAVVASDVGQAAHHMRSSLRVAAAAPPTSPPPTAPAQPGTLPAVAPGAEAAAVAQRWSDAADVLAALGELDPADEPPDRDAHAFPPTVLRLRRLLLWA